MNNYDTYETETVRDEDCLSLFENLRCSLKSLESDEFDVVFMNADDNIEFGISTAVDKTLPENVGLLFMNIDYYFDVDIQITGESSFENYYQIKISKHADNQPEIRSD